jgi:acetolactate synthase I/II/III large subunit
MKVKVSDYAARFLADRGMTHLFGISGAGCLHLFDSVVRLGRSELINPHHEQAATMACHGYHFATNRPTAAILTTGGGAANGFTGVLGAWMDSVPMMILSGNENSKHTRPDNPLRVWGVQGFDVLAAVRGITKYTARVTDPTRIRYELEAAYWHTMAGRRGPVWLDIPLNVQSATVEESELAGFDPPEPAKPALDPAVVDAVIAELRAAERPVLWLGQGLRFAGGAHLVAELVDRLRIPVLVSWSGLDLLDDHHPRAAGRAAGVRPAGRQLHRPELRLPADRRHPTGRSDGRVRDQRVRPRRQDRRGGNRSDRTRQIQGAVQPTDPGRRQRIR